MSETPLKITPEQQRQFDEDGFFLVEDALPPDRITALLQRLDELYDRYRRERDLGPRQAFQMRNIATDSPSRNWWTIPHFASNCGPDGLQYPAPHVAPRRAPAAGPRRRRARVRCPGQFFPLARRRPQLRLARGRWSAAVYGDESRLLFNRPDPTFERCHLRCARQPSPIAVD